MLLFSVSQLLPAVEQTGISLFQRGFPLSYLARFSVMFWGQALAGGQ
jgi:hypothetical protein